jgi:hypothetical protein
VIAGYLLSQLPLAYALAFIAVPDLVVAAACIGLDRVALDAVEETQADVAVQPLTPVSRLS